MSLPNALLIFGPIPNSEAIVAIQYSLITNLSYTAYFVSYFCLYSSSFSLNAIVDLSITSDTSLLLVGNGILMTFQANVYYKNLQA